MTAATVTDAVVIGAGPVGLFQAFQLGLLGLQAQLIDPLPEAGGQCLALYPDKPIYDIPALPLCTGRELAQRLLQQLAPFKPGLHLGQQVTGLQRCDDGSFELHTSAGLQLHTRSVFIAAGVGAFLPRQLKLPGIEAFRDRQLHYHPAQAVAGARTVVLGADETALRCALQQADLPGPADQPAAGSVTLVHRREAFTAEAATLARWQALRAQGRVHFVAGQPEGFDSEGARLTALHLALPDGGRQTLPLDQLLAFTGLSPQLGPIADWGLGLDHKLIPVDTERFQTCVPGIYAVGDINHYPGKRKLIVSGFHEATLAAYAAAEQLNHGVPVPLQYTTSSSLLQRRLGVIVAPGNAV